MSNIVCKRLNKTYKGASRALNNLNLHIADKEFVVLLGASGCGKTTLLRAICGIEELDSGEIFRDGQKINDVMPSKRNMALLSQNYALYPHLSVYENMAFPLVVRKMPNSEIKRRVDAVAEQLELMDVLVRKPKQLSGGQQQRVALGRAIVRKPDILLLDEPLSNLDVKLRTKIRTQIGTLVRENGITCLYVTHDQAEAMAIADKIAIMDKGRIIQCDTPDTVCNYPDNTFVATFLNADNITFIDCTADRQGKTVQLINGYQLAIPEDKQSLLRNSPAVTTMAVRSQHVKIGEQGIEGTVKSITLLGNQQKITLSSDNMPTITALCPSMRDYVMGEKVRFSFINSEIYLFDCNGNNIFSPPQINYLPCKLIGNHLLYKDNDYLFPDNYTATLFDFAQDKCERLGVDSSKVDLAPLDDALPLTQTVDFSIKHQNKWLVYCKQGEGYFVFTADEPFCSGENVTVYMPVTSLSLYDGEGNRLNSFRIHPNTAQCTIKTVEDKTHIKVGNAHLVYPAIQGVVDGSAEITLLSDKLHLAHVYDTSKKRKAPFTENTLTASAYDEDNIGSLNAVFVKIDGWDNYVTIVLKDKFSVYNTPLFEVFVPQDGFVLKQ